ncbi:hypothetical protein [uncultured Methanobacterium sp.]|uniref:hypothetical protein n=1 Tax=uncultured Methanobacterium sp. TaxID=176306 RepID=UPI002804BE8D|nr:hypothetical protein [uncultured Methanobacterium sp.]
MMETKEKEKEVSELLPTSKYGALNDLNISESYQSSLNSLKNSINILIFKAMDLKIPKEKIEILVAAGDVIDNIIDVLNHQIAYDKMGLREVGEQL